MTNPGMFVWHELMTTDVEGAIAFYSEVIGWKTQPFEGGPTPYTMFCVGEFPVGGVMLLPEEAKAHGAPPHWLGHVEVADLDATVEKSKTRGGTIAKAMEIPHVGKFAITRDPQGAVLSSYQPAPKENAPTPPASMHGRVTWNELNTTDWEAAWSYYSEVYGWTENSRMEMGPEMGTYFMYQAPGSDHHLGGMSNVAKVHGFPPHWLYYVEVDDLDAAQERVKANGGEVQNEMPVPGGKIAHCKDPQGVMFALHQQLEGK